MDEQCINCGEETNGEEFCEDCAYTFLAWVSIDEWKALKQAEAERD